MEIHGYWPRSLSRPWINFSPLYRAFSWSRSPENCGARRGHISIFEPGRGTMLHYCARLLLSSACALNVGVSPRVITWVLAARFVRVIYACVKRARLAASRLGSEKPLSLDEVASQLRSIRHSERRKREKERERERRKGGRGKCKITIYTSGLRTARLFTRDFLLFMPRSPSLRMKLIRVSPVRATQRMADNNFSLRQVRRESRGRRFIFRSEFLMPKFPLPRVQFLRNANHVHHV